MKKSLCILFSLFLAISLVFNTGMYAGTTGKIQGTITDSDTKEALPGVNIVVEGTTMGAAADENGYFFILNVPPGTYSVKASMVGYSTETREDVRVFVDRTTTEDLLLKSSTVAGEEVTVTATRDPVPLDVSQTEAYISGEDIVETPVGRLDELMGYQAGIEFEVESMDRGFSVRGGGVYETDIQLDGISLQNKQSRQSAVPLSRNLIQDVQILTGGFNAEYGNLRSGLINIITKDGSFNRYSGVLEGRYRKNDPKMYWPDTYETTTDPKAEIMQVYWGAQSMTGIASTETYHWKNRPENNWDFYRTWEGWNKYASNREYGAQFYSDVHAWLARPQAFMETGDAMLDLSGGGPVPGLPNTKFYASTFWNRSEYPLLASRSRSHEYNTSLKVTNRLKSNMVLTFSHYGIWVNALSIGERGTERIAGKRVGTVGGIASSYITGDDRDRFARGGYLYGQSKVFAKSTRSTQYDKTHAFNLKFTHTVSPSTYYEAVVGLILYQSNVGPMRLVNPTIIHHITDSETGTTVGFDELPFADPGGYFYLNPDGFYFSGTTGTSTQITGWKRLHDNFNQQLNFKFDFVSQVNRYNQIKAGLLIDYTNIYESASSYLNAPHEIGAFHEDWTKYQVSPMQFDWYVQDKLEWEGMIMNFGLRGLAFFPRRNALDFGPHNYYDVDSEGGLLWSDVDAWGDIENDPNSNWMWQNQLTRKVKTKMYLMPRAGISHPITEASKIFFNYGHFFSSPGLNQLYSRSASPILGGRWGGPTGDLGITDLKWPKVISYEIGYSQSIYNQFLLQISGYYKDYSDEIKGARIENYNAALNTSFYTNNSYRDVRGLEFRVERSFGRFVNGWANYNYMISSDGNTNLFAFFEDPTKAANAWYDLAQDKAQTTPSFRINLSLRTPIGFGPGSAILGIKPLAEWRVNMLYTWKSRGSRLMNSGDAPKNWRYVDYTPIQTAQLYVTKRLARGAQFYINVQNIFNIKRLRSEDRDSLHFWYETGDQHGNDRIGEIRDYQYKGHPKWRWYYPDHRDIYFGLRYAF